MRPNGYSETILQDMKKNSPFIYSVVTGSPEDVARKLTDPTTNLYEHRTEEHYGAFFLLAWGARGKENALLEMDPDTQEVFRLLIADPRINVLGSHNGNSGLAALDKMYQQDSPYLAFVEDFLIQRNAVVTRPMRREIEKALEAATDEIFNFKIAAHETPKQRGYRIENLIDRTQEHEQRTMTEEQASKALDLLDAEEENRLQEIALLGSEQFPAYVAFAFGDTSGPNKLNVSKIEEATYIGYSGGERWTKEYLTLTAAHYVARMGLQRLLTPHYAAYDAAERTSFHLERSAREASQQIKTALGINMPFWRLSPV